MKNKCPNCQYPLSKEWDYCPRCGANINKWYDKVSFGLEDIIQNIMKDIQSMFFNNLFGINVSSHTNKSHYRPLPSTHPNNHTHKETNNPVSEKESRKVEEVIEPPANIIQGEGFLEVEMDVKEVKNLEDITVKLYDNSAEIRAYTPDNSKMYFKIIELPQYTQINVKKLLNFEDNKAIIRFEYSNVVDYGDIASDFDDSE